MMLRLLDPKDCYVLGLVFVGFLGAFFLGGVSSCLVGGLEVGFYKGLSWWLRLRWFGISDAALFGGQ